MSQYNFDLSITQLGAIEKTLLENTSSKLFPRDRLGFLEEYIELIVSEKKTTTIRFRRGMIDFPVSEIVPIFLTNNNSSNQVKIIGWAKILSLRILPFGDLDDKDAASDGFFSLAEMKNALNNIYGEIKDAELVSVYKFDYLKRY